jgi:hypothetical protein
MLLKYFASIYPLGASVLKHLIILECPTSGHLTKFLIFLSNPHPLPAPLPPGLILIGALFPQTLQIIASFFFGGGGLVATALNIIHKISKIDYL